MLLLGEPPRVPTKHCTLTLGLAKVADEGEQRAVGAGRQGQRLVVGSVDVVPRVVRACGDCSRCRTGERVRRGGGRAEDPGGSALRAQQSHCAHQPPAAATNQQVHGADHPTAPLCAPRPLAPPLLNTRVPAPTAMLENRLAWVPVGQGRAGRHGGQWFGCTLRPCKLPWHAQRQPQLLQPT